MTTDYVVRFRKAFLSTQQARIHMACYLIVLAVSLLASVVTGSVELFVMALSMTLPMFLSTYAINCYVVGSCHGLSWFSTGLTLLWTSLFFLKLFVGGVSVRKALRK